MQLIIDAANTSISVRNRCFYVSNKQIQRQISPNRVSSISITVNCMINTAAIKLAAHKQIPILFYNNFGTLQARMCSPYFTNLASLRKKQYLFSQSPLATKWMLDLLVVKAEEQVRNIKRGYKRKGLSEIKYQNAVEQINIVKEKMKAIDNMPMNSLRPTLLGWEGTISRTYFEAIRPLMPAEFEFNTRSRQPALDFFNAGLNYIYGMTYGIVESGLLAKGLDPGVGIMHVDAYQKPTLAYDLIEPFRPLVDRILLNLIWEQQLSGIHFIPKEQGYWMNKAGKRIIIQNFSDFLHQRMEVSAKY
jgi:CRISPR-associated protein Cas1